MRVCHLGLHQPFVSFFVSTNETSADKQVSELLGDCRADFQSTIKENFPSAPATCNGLQTFCGECWCDLYHFLRSPCNLFLVH